MYLAPRLILDILPGFRIDVYALPHWIVGAYKRACRESKAIFDISLDDQELRLRGQKFDDILISPLAELD